MIAAVLKNLASPASRYFPVLRRGFAIAEEYASGHRAPCTQAGPGVDVAVALMMAMARAMVGDEDRAGLDGFLSNSIAF